MKFYVPFRKSLVVRYVLMFFCIVFSVLGIGFLLIYYSVQDQLRDSIHKDLQAVCREKASQLDQPFLQCQSVAKTFAAVLAQYSKDQWKDIFISANNAFSLSHSKFYAAGVATVPEEGENDLKTNLILVVHRDDKIEVKEEDGPGYLEKSWFADVVKSGKEQWNDPFYGPNIHEQVAVYSCPVFRTAADGSQKIIGVVCIDISIRYLEQLINDQEFIERGAAFLLTPTSQILSERIDSDMGRKLGRFDCIKGIPPGDIKAFGEHFMQTSSTDSPENVVLHSEDSNADIHCFFHPMLSTSWIFGIVFHESEMYSPVDYFKFGIRVVIAGIFIGMFLVALVITHRIRVPLRLLTMFANAIGRGEFQTPMPIIKGEDEIAMLAGTIDKMRTNLVEHVNKLKMVTSAQEMIESELLIAQNIQFGLLPDIRPPFPNSPFFEISARMIPAKEIGGDLYDCAMLSPGKLRFAIGDVSGKGVPAALFMAITQMLQRLLWSVLADSPCEIVRKMNLVLCSNNRGRLFVTFLCGFIDAETGVMTYCNAGHDPFFVLKKNGSLENPCRRNGIPLGVRSEANYTESTCQLDPDDTVVLYTDGIPEAENADHEFFGMERFKSLLQNIAGQSCPVSKMQNDILKTVHSYSGFAQRSDDITCMTIRYCNAVKNTDVQV